MMRYLSGRGFFPLQEEEGKGGGGAGSRAEIEATVERLLAAKGDKTALAELLRDNFSQREQLRDMKAKLEGAAKVPDGGLVLDATQATAWKLYQELGKPEDLKKAVDRKAELETEVTTAKWAKSVADAAAAHGWKAEVLSQLPGADGLRFELREETVDGEKVKVAYVTAGEQGATPQKLTEYAEKSWKGFLPALESEDDGEQEEQEQPPQETRRMIRQRGDGKPAPKGALAVDKVIESKRRDRRYSSL